LSSVGLELVLTYSLLFEEPDRVRLGAALEPDSGSFSAYLALGWSF
jgi:hypothetical protein